MPSNIQDFQILGDDFNVIRQFENSKMESILILT
jgi:hypothetical protein